eukprot:gene10874-biopygen4395
MIADWYQSNIQSPDPSPQLSSVVLRYTRWLCHKRGQGRDDGARGAQALRRGNAVRRWGRGASAGVWLVYEDKPFGGS